MISLTWTGLRTTSSMPAVNNSSVCSSERTSDRAMIGARERLRMILGQVMRSSKSPRTKLWIALVSSLEAAPSHSRNSSGTKPRDAIPSRLSDEV